MLSKRYESTDVDRITWLRVPSGTPWSTSSDTHQVVEIKKRLLLRCIHHFKSDLINDMDHVRLILFKFSKLSWKFMPKSAKTR